MSTTPADDKDQAWRDSVTSDLRIGDRRMDAMTAELTALKAAYVDLRGEMQTIAATTQRVEANTSEALKVFGDWKGAMRVLETIGQIARPVAYIVGLGTALMALLAALKTGTPPVK